MSYVDIDLNRFLSDELIQPDLLASFDRETPVILPNDFNDFLKLPVNEEYLKNQTLKATVITELVYCEPEPDKSTEENCLKKFQRNKYIIILYNKWILYTLVKNHS